MILTPNYGLSMPAVDDPADEDLWGGELNTNASIIDTALLVATKWVTRVITASETATLADEKKLLLVDATAGAVTETLPAGVTNGFTLAVKKTDASVNLVTIVGTIDGVANLVLSSQGSAATLIYNGTSWVRQNSVPALATTTVAGIAPLATNAEVTAGTVSNKIVTPASIIYAFANVFLGAAGYQKFPGGLILQWGTLPAATATVNYSSPFPNACFAVVGNATASQCIPAINARTLTSFGWNPGNVVSGGTWIAVGS